MFRWPTSELPIWPSGNPTRSSDASIDVCGQVASSRRQWGASARVIALSGASSRQPKPSRISSTTGRTAGLAAAACGAGRVAGGVRVSIADTLSFRTSQSSWTFMEFITNNWSLALVFVVSGAMLLWPLIKGRLSSTEQIGTLEATRLINNENPLLLDVREPNEYVSGHLPDALHIPLSQIKDRSGELAKYATRPVIVYCERGMRSSSAASALSKLGFSRVLELRGGLRAWRDAGLPTKNDGGKIAAPPEAPGGCRCPP